MSVSYLKSLYREEPHQDPSLESENSLNEINDPSKTVLGLNSFEEALMEEFSEETPDLNEKIEYMEISLKNFHEQKTAVARRVNEQRKKIEMLLVNLNACGQDKSNNAKATKKHLRNDLKNIRNLLLNYNNQSDRLNQQIEKTNGQISNLKDKKLAIEEKIEFNI